MAEEQFPAARTALEEYRRIEQQMAQPDVASSPDEMRKLGRRHAELGAIVSAYTDYLHARDDAEAAREMAGEDPDFEAEAKRLEDALPAAEERLRTALIPRDPDDARDVIMEIKAGTGGEEAALFAGDLLRMYTRYAEKRGWGTTVQSENTTELGGVKDVQLAIRAKGTPAPEEGVWASLKYEGGVHRVQRIPVTESQGRIQTSAAGVSVFPEADEDDDEIDIDPKDLKVDTFMSSGPGGQSVNTTYSAVRMTHIPTGIVVNMQDEKSQIQNRASALRVLKSRLLAMKHEQEAAEAADMRHSQVRSLDRSERIRTYNFPENRIVDHRTNYKAYNLDAVLDGDLQAVIDSDIQADEAQRLAKTDE
ncbi:MAG: peptide chain release factor 1 [Bifidobacterium castoris]|nr:peptide chain release factor 1 [Bifidobacterium castoris]